MLRVDFSDRRRVFHLVNRVSIGRRHDIAGEEGGRPPKLTDDDIEAAKALLANPDIGVTQIAHRLGVSPATLYRYIPAARTANTPGV